MKINFRKVTALGSSLLMAGMSMATPILAANYPAPFISGSSSNVAIVYGTGTGVSSLDLIQAGNIQTDLQSRIGGTTTTTTASVEGEAFPLFTTSRKLYMNDAINSVKTALTDSQLATVLADSELEGDVSSDVTQKIVLSSNPTLVYGKHPDESEDDPTVAIQLGTTPANYIYNATVTISPAIDFTSTDTIGESLEIFGREYTVGAGTTNTTLYLFESSETISLSIGGSDPSTTTVTIDDETFTVELTGASDTAATVKVTDADGNSQTKEINEDASKKIQGIDVAVDIAQSSEATSSESAQITVGADKLKLQDSSEVRYGSDEDLIEGTNVAWANNGWAHSTGFTIQVWAEDTETDAIEQGGTFTDPVFGSFKIDFTSLMFGEEDEANREMIEVDPAGDDKATVKFTTHTGDEANFNFYYNVSGTAMLGDSSGDAINVREGAIINKSEYVVVGNEENGYVLELKSIVNGTDDFSDDYIEFKDVFSDKTYKSDSPTSEGTVSISIEGEEYTAKYVDNKGVAGDEYVTLDYPDTTAGYMVMYPTVETSLGANLAFYEPLVVDLSNYDNAGTDVGRMYFPDGDGYTYASFTLFDSATGVWNVSDASATAVSLNTSDTESLDITIGRLTYTLSSDTNLNQTTVKLKSGSTIDLPGVVVFEEEDDQTTPAYNAVIVKMEGDGTDTDGIGVSDAIRTWDDTTWDRLQLESDDDLYKEMDLWGTIITTDESSSGESTVDISYPDQQVYAQLYVAEDSASITAGGSTSGGSTLGDVLVKDTEVASVNSKNLIIVGGSCINSAAADVLGGAYCGASFTEQTGVGSGQFLIEGVEGAYTSGKIALLVAGFEAADTVNAATYVRTQTFDTMKKYVGTSSTSAELVTEETTA